MGNRYQEDQLTIYNINISYEQKTTIQREITQIDKQECCETCTSATGIPKFKARNQTSIQIGQHLVL
jgi:hypothetical protein